MNTGMKFDFMGSWKQNQDLNFGEINEVANAAEQAAVDKARDIRRRHAELECDVEQTP